MSIHVNPLRLAVMFDGDQRDIQGMARDAVGQLAETAKGLGRDVLVKGAQTMDVPNGGLVNWTNWVTADAFDQNRAIQLAHCYPSRGGVLLSALYPLAVENEALAKVDALTFPPRFVPEKIDAVLLATGRNKSGISEEFQDMFKLREILNGTTGQQSQRRGSFQHAAHSGLVHQGTRVYSLATVAGVETVVQEKLSEPTKGRSFHGSSKEVKELVDAMMVTLADPEGARKRLVDNRFAQQLEYSKA